MTAQFASLHRQRYGHNFELPVELALMRLQVTNAPLSIALPKLEAVPDGDRQAEVIARSQVPVNNEDGTLAIMGPRIIRDQVATIWLPEPWQALRTDSGHLLLSREG